MKKISNIFKWWWLKDKYLSIRSWFYNSFTKEHFAVAEKAFTSYPYDYSYLLELEQRKLIEMREYFKKGHITTKETYDNMLKYINLAISMLDIMLDKKNIYTYHGEMEFIEIDKKDENGEPLYELKPDCLKYECLVKVNTKNYKRFIPPHMSDNMVDLYLKEPSRLYELKAKYLYYKIRHDHTEEWWD